MNIADLRAEMGLSLSDFAQLVGQASRGTMSVIERDNRCSVRVALKIEELSGGRIDAADLNDDVRMARASCGGGCSNIATGAGASSGKALEITEDSPAGVPPAKACSVGDEAGAGAQSPVSPRASAPADGKQEAA